ncbi:MAG: hypothetical protein ACLPUG_18745 [Acidimicrobiales bacterium]|jgi:hypothetical protein
MNVSAGELHNRKLTRRSEALRAHPLGLAMLVSLVAAVTAGLLVRFSPAMKPLPKRLGRYDAAQETICEQLRAVNSRQGDPRSALDANLVVGRVEASSPSTPTSVGLFDPVKVAGRHDTRRNYNYFEQLNAELEELAEHVQ